MESQDKKSIAESTTGRRPIRRIEHAIFEGIGPISADELVSMPLKQWTQLRTYITDARAAKPRRDIARCLMCGEPVFIQSKKLGQTHYPLYAHFKSSTKPCLWFTGTTTHPNGLRAQQYNGQQTSIAHDLLCRQLADLARLDTRCTSVEIESYLPPTENSYGRYPDVLIRMNDRRPIAIEVQLSNTFQTEISARCLHYPRENVDLIWVLYGIQRNEPGIRQSFRDVMVRHRHNAFFLDTEAIKQSKDKRKLIFRCDLLDDRGCLQLGAYVSLDDLTYPERGLPFYSDLLLPALLQKGRNARKSWHLAFNNTKREFLATDYQNPLFQHALEDLICRIPNFGLLTNEWRQRKTFFIVVAVAFSIVSYATNKFNNYADKNPNISAMLNNKLMRPDLAPYTLLLQKLIRETKAAPVLSGSVLDHLNRAVQQANGNFLQSDDPQAQAFQYLFPEVFDGLTRLELLELNEMPEWARSGMCC